MTDALKLLEEAMQLIASGQSAEMDCGEWDRKAMVCVLEIKALLESGGWIEQPDIPNVDAQNVFERDIGKPLVTRSKTGKWYLHAPLPQLPKEKA